MGKIKTLPDVLVSKIAAGEVVERPASVVKELVENSIDAGADRISVHLEAGGRKLVRVVDNGHGMSRDDAIMSIERHATSKIKDIDDLFSLGTLGFRGEALPSIASVSRFRIVTAAEGSQGGTEVYVEGGIVKKVRETAAPPGSSVEVKNLFFNTPPRLKFLKRPETELTRALEIIQREALARPSVAFEVFSNGKSLHRYAARETLEERVTQVVPGVSLYEIGFEDDTLRVYGYLGSPLEPRSSMQRFFTYVNGRPVRDRFINRVVMNSYGKTIDKGKYPQGAIFIERDPHMVDVNVHPTKSEVRFENQYAVGQSIARAIGGMLADAPWMKGYKERTKKALEDFYQKRGDSPEPPERTDYASGGFSGGPSGGGTFPRGRQDSVFPAGGSGSGVPAASRGEETDMFPEGFYSSLKFLGQVGRLYLVCEGPNGMIVVDQHAAHERINFERIKSGYADSGLSCSQDLLVAEVVELTAREASSVRQFGDEIERLGFGFEIFGENAVRIKSVPGFLKDSDYAKVFQDLLDELDDLGDAKSLGEHLDAVCATVACHASITANRVLSEREARSLFADMDKASDPHACPHGRPVAAEISHRMLERMFKRS